MYVKLFRTREKYQRTPASPSAYITSLLCLYPNTDTRLTSTHIGLYFYTEPSLTCCLHQQPHLLPSSTASPLPPIPPPLRLTPKLTCLTSCLSKTPFPDYSRPPRSIADKMSKRFVSLFLHQRDLFLLRGRLSSLPEY
ncbi:unnamed protein product [Gadus morhua 'NCC']